MKWKTISKAPDYEVSDCGQIRTKKTKLLRSLNCPSKLYTYVNLYVNGKTKSFRVHRLVAEAYLPNPRNYPCVNHINGIKKDNNVKNLEWCTYSQNSIHAFETGLSVTKRKYSDEIEKAIAVLVNSKLCSQNQLAILLNTSQSFINMVCKRQKINLQ